MNALAWTIGMGAMVSILFASQNFHEASVCRQEAWRGSLILATRTLVGEPQERDQLFAPKCGLTISRKENEIKWMRPGKKQTNFELSLEGKL